MSGASLTAGGENYRVIKVRSLIENFPAAKAGRQAGDTITSISEKPIAGMTLEQLHRMFGQAGQTKKLSVKRNESSLTFNLRTRRTD